MIQRAQKGDLAALQALETECFSEAWSEKSLLQLLDNPDYLTLLERDAEGNALTYLIGWQIAGEAELARIGVTLAARRQGLAGQMLHAALLIWRTARVQNVWLEVRQSNVAARRLYEKRGFTVVGTRKNYYADGEDALVLRLEL